MSHLQVSFFSTDSRFPVVGADAINLPAASGIDELNLLANTIAKNANDQWEHMDFDFLINGTLLRTELAEFVDTHGISTESVIKIECILKKPPPTPRKVIRDNNWVSGVKAADGLLYSTNYAGEVTVWSDKCERLQLEKVDTEMAKCLDVFDLGGERHIVVGVQKQFLTLYKQQRGPKSTEGDMLELIPCAVLRGHQRSVECVAAKPEGTHIVSGGFDNCLKIWSSVKEDGAEGDYDTQSTKPKKVKRAIATKVPMVTLESHKDVVTGVRWNPLDEKQVVTVSWDNSAICWDLETAETVSTLVSHKAFTSLSLSNVSGLMITGSTDPVIRMWDFRSKEGSMVKESFFGHTSWVSSVCWSPNNEHLFASGSYDKSVKMWDMRSPKAPLYDITGHEDKVLSVDWSMGELLASGSADSTIRTFRL